MSDSGITVPTEWGSIPSGEMQGTVLVIGPPDSGKSAFSRWLAAELCRYHARVGWIDPETGEEWRSTALSTAPQRA